ncbi:uncharacterized protein Z520_01057 [Fonsecaea multimorphosa CBS 102226]|uniref:Uncharacterized protein n=1 Tax=Fonsecaea multimorphosa CBS 102226 TaxID=1442371 RepID=A0A0D2IZS5_9EURO|nr:uncharacterized protein Z520_01057 [Fonsecaea multimorphosa CBS 102226]KIY02592.1 hypothetical protein Z520_01057 [Fonsecaea multimorphosa CBS 102226]OAL31458.1 hypothetical protein AYO22_01050 [Fonsecaea multimorphosa]
MSRPSSSRNSLHLEPPRKSVELEDPGAHELSSEGEDEHFSDASEGQKRPSRPVTPASPIPKTRIEKVDDEPRYGEVPGTPAYEKRVLDAVPDEVEVVQEGRLSKRSSQLLEPPTTPGGTLIPRTVVEKLDPESPSYGEIPKTSAYLQRRMDAVPDVILKTPEPGRRQHYNDDEGGDGEGSSISPDIQVPETIVTRVDSNPAHGEVPGTEAQKKRKLDAAPDITEKQGSGAGSPILNRSLNATRRRSTLHDDDDDDNNGNDHNDNDFGDDFDEFEEGAQAGADDDFGDFGDGFQEPENVESPPPVSTSQSSFIPADAFPLIDSGALSSIPDFVTAAQMHLDAMFPSSTTDYSSRIPPQQPIPDSSPIFPSDRSRSLWKQLITPPPLQPPNWTQSRIRRLFLVSLGVPVDLDEILPPSKQKKLILPDINLEPSSRRSEGDKTIGSLARLKAQAGANDSSASLDSTQSGAAKEGQRASRSRKPKGPPPPPELDLAAVKRLCATTEEKLEGLTDEELQSHVEELNGLTARTSEVLEYWLKRRDGLVKEKEAFEGVIENLVRHARRVRK